MAEKQQISHVSGRTILLTAAAGLIIGAPLLSLMAFIFLTTMTLLLIASPLFIIFSPLLFGAACVFALAMLGFAIACGMAVVGVSMVVRVLRPLASRGFGVERKFVDQSGGGGGVKEADWAGYLHQKEERSSPYDDMVNRDSEN